jgi:hypothetical protein
VVDWEILCVISTGIFVRRSGVTVRVEIFIEVGAALVTLLIPRGVARFVLEPHTVQGVAPVIQSLDDGIRSGIIPGGRRLRLCPVASPRRDVGDANWGKLG